MSWLLDPSMAASLHFEKLSEVLGWTPDFNVSVLTVRTLDTLPEDFGVSPDTVRAA
jgi:hypothetical protein